MQIRKPLSWMIVSVLVRQRQHRRLVVGKMSESNPAAFADCCGPSTRASRPCGDQYCGKDSCHRDTESLTRRPSCLLRSCRVCWLPNSVGDEEKGVEKSKLARKPFTAEKQKQVLNLELVDHQNAAQHYNIPHHIVSSMVASRNEI